MEQQIKRTKRPVIQKKLRDEIYYRDACRCVYCGFVLPPHEFKIDHVVSWNQIQINQRLVKKGGRAVGGMLDFLDPKNLVVSCEGCNSQKSNLTVEQFRSLLEIKYRKSHLFYFEKMGFGTWNMSEPKHGKVFDVHK